MGQARPKLWMVGTPGLPLDELKQRLGDTFDIVSVPPAPLTDMGADGSPALLLVSPADVRKLAAAPAAASSLLDTLGQGVCLLRAGGEIVWSNTKFLRYDEVTRARIAAAAGEALEHFRAGAVHDSTKRVEIASSDGLRFYEVVMSPAGAPSRPGAPIDTVAALIRDITTDRRLRMKLDAIDQAGSQLVSFEAATVRKMNVFERLRLLETRIVQLCRDLMKFDHFSIRLIDERTGRLEIVMSTGLPQEAIELEIYPLPEDNGITGYVAATGRSYICADTSCDSRFLPGLANARSSLTVPLRLHDRVIGVFNIESDRPDAFTEDDRQFAEIFGRYVAIALHMLNLLVVERSTINEAISGRVEGELSEPLRDILQETDWFKDLAARDPEAARHIERIRADVESINRRVKNVATGPQTLLGLEGAMAERKHDPLLQGRRVLVADDEANVRRIIHDVLHNRGCEVTTHESGVGAIASLEERAAAGGPTFDVVISDIRMPDRNGYEVFAAARKVCPGVPVILMTGFGYDPHHSIVRASQEGLQAVLFKPFPVDRLLDEIRKAVGPKSPG